MPTKTRETCFLFLLLTCISLPVCGQPRTPEKMVQDNKAASPIFHVGGDVTAPKTIYAPEPEFSGAALKAGYGGTCVLSVIVDTNGRPRDIRVVRKLGKQLDEMAIRSLSEWKFEPAQKAGKPVAVLIEVEFSFKHFKNSEYKQTPSSETEEMREAQSRIQNQVYRIPLGDESSACSTSPSDRHGPVATVAELLLEGDLRRSSVNRDRIGASLKQQTYFGSEGQVASEVSDRVQRAWQNDGYFAVQAHAEVHVLTSGPSNERVAVIVQIDEGQQYRLEEIRFKNNRTIQVKALRNLFPIKDGDIFNRDAIEKGMQNLHRAYGEYGYINISPVPTTQIHEEQRTVSLDIDIDEGKQFLISRVEVVGLDEAAFENVKHEMTLQLGGIYNERLMELFQLRYTSRLPAHESLEPRYQLHTDETAGTVVITFDFRHCHPD